MGSIIKQVSEPERLAVCIDTCHAFAAGYNLSSSENYVKTWEEFDKEIGLAFLEVIHLNDSKTKLGSHIDRHEKIGDGFLGSEAFKYLLNDRRFSDIPGILETPDSKGGYEIDLDVLKSLISV